MPSNIARKWITGPDPHLPSFIVERMLEMDVRPTLTQLAMGTGVPLATLRENLKGASAMKLSTAVRLADFLRCDLAELVENARLS